MSYAKIQYTIDPPKRAAVYARFSSHAQNEQSIEGQLRVAQEYAEKNNIIIVKEYIDKALSGTNDNRPDFQKMMNDAPLGLFDIVLVYKLDRFARKRIDSVVYENKLEKHGVRLVSIMENIGDSTESVLLKSLLQGLAEYYSLDLSQKIKRGRTDTASKGKFCGGPLPLGYKSENGYLVEDPGKSHIPKYIFARYLQGASRAEIQRELEAKGWYGKNNKALQKNGIYRILQNQVYTGTLKQGDIIAENACPAFVSKEDFATVQQVLAYRKKTAGSATAKTNYLLSGKVFCGHCGQPMHGLSGHSKTGAIYHYYACKSKRKNTENKCNKQHEPKDRLETYVITQSIQNIFTKSVMNYLATQLEKQIKQSLSAADLSRLQKDLSHIDSQIHKTTEVILETPSSLRPTFYSKLESLQNQKSALELEIARLKSQQSRALNKEEIHAWLSSLAQQSKSDPSFQTQLIRHFINSIFVYDDHLLIYYNITSQAPLPHNPSHPHNSLHPHNSPHSHNSLHPQSNLTSSSPHSHLKHTPSPLPHLPIKKFDPPPLCSTNFLKTNVTHRCIRFLVLCKQRKE